MGGPYFATKAKGMGMGLAVSKTIIEAPQGKIWAKHRPEGGACFGFTVPVARGEGNKGSVISNQNTLDLTLAGRGDECEKLTDREVPGSAGVSQERI